MPDKEKAREELKKLIQRHHNQRAEIVNEQQVCDSLVRPFFNKVLGWDTEDPSEFRSQFSQRGKRIDYLTFLNGISQFIIEVKELGHEIRHNFQDYEQALNYAKNKDKPFAILTNFSQFIILANTEAAPLQCEVKTIDIEKAVESEADFDVLWNFQKEVWAAEKGDVLYKLKPGKKSLPVDKRLVDDLKKWRLSLLTNLKKHPRLNDFADFEKEMPYIEQEVQKFIDRLIFICYCEDKDLKERELKNALETKESNYSGREGFLAKEIKCVFDDYRKQYNSDLFFEQGYCDRFRFEDAVLAEILKDLRKPFKKWPYDFSAIESDVLGKAYENFIGHVVTGTKRFNEKESISKRKEEGVYYTPQYIVNYIVDNTLRSYVKENGISSFDGILKIKVLDPACGSGTFLIRAFEVIQEEARKLLGRETNYDENIKLLTSCIFGVDKDERAVDIAKLRLSLTLAARQKLPELGKNIQCGDSLIDDDAVVPDGKAFKWAEKFKDVMRSGGFDMVVGNPPYVRSELEDKEYQKQRKWMETSGKYSTLYEKWDLFVAFIERGLKLLKKEGYLSLIISNSFNTSKYADKIKKYIIDEYWLKQIDFFKDVAVFEGVGVESVIILVQTKKFKGNTKRILHAGKFNNVKELPSSNNISDLFRISSTINFTNKFSNSVSLGDVCFVSKGMVIHSEEVKYKGEFTKDDLISDMLTKIHTKKYVEAKDLQRYAIKKIKYLEWGTKRSPAKLSRPTFQELYVYPKLIRGRTTDGTYDEEGILCNESACVFVLYDNLKEVSNRSIEISITKWNNKNRKELETLSRSFNIKYILSILNSKFAKFYLNTIRRHRIEYYFYSDDFKKLPIKKVSSVEQQPFIRLVDKILSLHRRLSELGDRHTVERERIEDEIKKTDAEIDGLVYQLYGITDEEKKIIEESLK